MENKLEIELMSKWMGEKPCYFFGPCSAESPDQLRATAKGISANFENIVFRAGVWKPRTRPNTFEGVGEDALSWLQDIKAEFGFRITTEVAKPQHVEACLKAGVDILWIGARTTVSPFSVQSIADALVGVDIPVFIKNPLNPDIGLWIGALERINKAGVKRIGAIHRGFHLINNSPYRSAPEWDIAIHMKSAFPDLPLICDVSHISGKPSLIPHVAQKAVDFDMDGLMIETHCDPSSALSDRQQQITPENLHRIIKELIPKSRLSPNEEFKNKLELLRENIDRIDDDILEKIATRMELSKQIGIYKKENSVTVLQVQRWQKILQRNLKSGEALNLSNRFIQALFNSIHDESIRKQTSILEKDEE